MVGSRISIRLTIKSYCTIGMTVYRSLLNLSGKTKCAFYKLEGIVFPVLDYRKRGRPPILDSFGQLGLYLFFVGSTVSTKFICLIFGVIPSSANSIIDKMRKMVCGKLGNHQSSKVIWPTTEEMEEWASLIHGRELIVNCLKVFCDGVATHIKCNDSEGGFQYWILSVYLYFVGSTISETILFQCP